MVGGGIERVLARTARRLLPFGRSTPARRTARRARRAADYDAFISYSHAVDGKLAPALQTGLHRFAKRPLGLRALRVFRDEASLSANPALWAAIETALSKSRYLLLLASLRLDASSGEALQGDDAGRLELAEKGETLAAISGSDDPLTLWDVKTRRQVGRLPWPNSGEGPAFGPEERWLLGGWGDRAAIWDLDVKAWTSAACKIANRGLGQAEWDLYRGGEYRPVCTAPRVRRVSSLR